MRDSIQLSIDELVQATAFAETLIGFGNSPLAISAYMLLFGNVVRSVTAWRFMSDTGLFMVFGRKKSPYDSCQYELR